MHRYQAEGVAKVIGGVDYNYAVKGFEEPINTPMSTAVQYKATQELLNTLSHQELSFPQSALNMILPSAKGFGRNRESFDSDMNMIFDPLNGAEAYTNFVLTLMLHPDRLARINLQEEVSLEEYLSSISSRIFTNAGAKLGYETQLSLIPRKVLTIHLIKLAKNKKINKQVAAMALMHLNLIQSKYLKKSASNSDLKANNMYLNMMIDQMNDPEMATLPGLADMPPGSPIGCGR